MQNDELAIIINDRKFKHVIEIESNKILYADRCVVIVTRVPQTNRRRRKNKHKMFVCRLLLVTAFIGAVSFSNV